MLVDSKRKITTLQTLKKIIFMIIKSNRINFLFLIVLGVLSSLFLTINTFAMEKFFDSATELSNKSATVEETIFYGIFFLVIFLLNNILNSTFNLQGGNFFNIAAGYLTNFINKKASRLEPIDYENIETLDYINKAHQGVTGGVLFVGVINMIITSYIPYFIFMGIYLFNLNSKLLYLLLCVFIPVIINEVIKTNLFENLENKLAHIRREFDFYEKCIVDREYFKETRHLGIFSYLNKKYNSSLNKMIKKSWKIEKKSNLIEILIRLVTILGYGVILLVLFTSLINKEISIGAFGAVLSSIGMLFSKTEEIICIHIGNISKNFGALKNLVYFLELEEKNNKVVTIKTPPTIEFKNVYFSYPYCKEFVLQNINFTIDSQETIAIVGKNGSGKSTLVKLILGLYYPTKGEVVFDGYNSKDISRDSIIENSSAVFQNFNKYKFTLGENVAISNIKKIDNKKIIYELKNMDINFNIKKFPDKLDTNLSKEFGSIDLSGGEWQKIAIARGLYKFNNLIILDEPTAAIDPIEEGRIFRKFKEISKGRTSIIVTHRMGTIKIANRIIILENGEINGIGTHDELLKSNKMYFEMYNSQSKWYYKSNN